MNNTGSLHGMRGYGSSGYGSAGALGYNRGRRREAKKAPAWLVAVCRFILRLTSEETMETVRPAFAIAAVTAVAVIAGAIGNGSIPLLQGGIICGCLSALALAAARD